MCGVLVPLSCSFSFSIRIWWDVEYAWCVGTLVPLSCCFSFLIRIWRDVENMQSLGVLVPPLVLFGCLSGLGERTV